MKTDELIRALRSVDFASEYVHKLINEAADRLEELDERISIMAADMDKEWGKDY